jgi:hypothetical protein
MVENKRSLACLGKETSQSNSHCNHNVFADEEHIISGAAETRLDLKLGNASTKDRSNVKFVADLTLQAILAQNKKIILCLAVKGDAYNFVSHC